MDFNQFSCKPTIPNQTTHAKAHHELCVLYGNGISSAVNRKLCYGEAKTA